MIDTVVQYVTDYLAKLMWICFSYFCALVFTQWICTCEYYMWLGRERTKALAALAQMGSMRGIRAAPQEQTSSLAPAGAKTAKVCGDRLRERKQGTS